MITRDLPMNSSRSLMIGRVFLFAGTVGLLYGAALEFYNISWGTGLWLGEFSMKWGLAFFAFVAFGLLALLAEGFVLWRTPRIIPVLRQLLVLRERIGLLRWSVAAGVLILPIWLLQYSPWGVVFSGPFLRVLSWGIVVLALGFFLSQGSDSILTFSSLLLSVLVTGLVFTLASSFADVTAYPFSLEWSEGNRLWDYSLLFGRHLYIYPSSHPPSAYLDFGRQLVGGLPFLLPQVTIQGQRLWLALMEILPYLLLGWLAFRPAEKTPNRTWILAGVWGFMFLNQGPIHPPLLLCAILVAIAWRQSLWLAVPLVAIAGYFAQVSRFTWIFAPAMWAVMLEFNGTVLDKGRVPLKDWGRALIVGLAGLFGGVFAPRAIALLQSIVPIQSGTTGIASSGVTVPTVTTVITNQPLLWYRLFPNATYGNGILLGLLIAAGPLVIILIYLAAKLWRLILLQKLSILLPLLAFLVVGLIVSTKIGGGGDLHNMDMFLVGLMFAAALAWRAAGAHWLADIQTSSIWMRLVVLLLVAIPALQPLMMMRPLSFAKDAEWLTTLADVERPIMLGSLPSDQVIASSLQTIRDEVKVAQTQGEVLFMDQRQLLTFGYIRDVTLVSEYEKKRMMDEALSGNAAYFQPFYRDLAAHRFSLIISDPLRTPIKDSEYGFGEENNAWVKWVAKPVLCYYEEKDILLEVRVELLVPRQGPNDCSRILP